MHIEQHRSEGGWWDMVSGLPAPSLRGYVRGYVGYREESSIPVRRREIPSGDVAVILSFGPKISVLDTADAGPVAAATSFVAAVGESWALTEYTGAQHGVEIKLSPPAAAMFLGVPMTAFATNVVVDIEDVLGTFARRLIDRLADAPDWASRFDLLDSAIMERLAQAHDPTPAAWWAWRRLRDSDGRIPIGRLAEDLGCSHRYLVSQFRAHVGVGPKTFARILRCQHVLRLLDECHTGVHPPDHAGGRRHLSEIAARCGYSDQSHLTREFRRLTGITPAAWRPDLQLDAQLWPAVDKS